MADPTPWQQRLSRIHNMQSDAALLMTGAADAMLKDVINMALQDIKLADFWLGRAEAEIEAQTLGFVDLTLRLAAERLAIIHQVLETSDSDAAAHTA